MLTRASARCSESATSHGQLPKLSDLLGFSSEQLAFRDIEIADIFFQSDCVEICYFYVGIVLHKIVVQSRRNGSK